MREPLLVINAGSSSIKFSIFETAPDRSLAAGAHGQVEGLGAATGTPARIEVADAQGRRLIKQPIAGRDHHGAMVAIHDWFAAHVGSEAAFAGVGHRVVHGGLAYAKPVLIDDKVLAAIEELVPLAPLHQPHNIAAIRPVSAIAPKVPQVACFGTAFHRSAPPLAQEFALPRALTAKGVRRYGFHGLSYEYIVSVMPRAAPDYAGRKLIVAHLGNGASMCAIAAGRSIATTMGMTALDGLPMGTRSGTLDPGVILYLLQHEGMDAKAVEHLIYEHSGLLGVSGLSSDMRTLLASDLPAAKEAVDLFVYRIARGGARRARCPRLHRRHRRACRRDSRARLQRRGMDRGLARRQSQRGRGACISRPASKVSAWVIPTDENLMIACHTRQLLDAALARHALR